MPHSTHDIAAGIFQGFKKSMARRMVHRLILIQDNLITEAVLGCKIDLQHIDHCILSHLRLTFF